MPKINRTNSKGLVQETGKGAVGIPFSESVVLTSTDGLSYTGSEVVQPAGSILVGITAVVTTEMARTAAGNGTLGIKVGDAAGEEDIAAAVANALSGAANDVAVGKGSSTHSEITTALQGAANIVIGNGAAYTALERKLHATVTRSANAFDAATRGAVTVHYEFISA